MYYIHIITVKVLNKAINVKESRKRDMRGFGVRKGKGKVM